MISGGSLSELSPIFFTSHYVLMLIINLVLCVGINSTIDYFVTKDEYPHYVVSGANSINMIVFAIIVAILVFFSGGQIHKRIREGKASPVTRRALCDTCFKKVILFSIQEPNWKKRIFLFIWNAILFPGVFLAIVVALLCMFSSGFASLGEANSCQVSTAANIIVIECWKAVGMAILFSMAYAAAHNEEQSEIADVMQGQNVMASALGDDGEVYD